jgi:hypothetical protein
MEQPLQASALRCLAAYVGCHSDKFVRSGPDLLGPAETESRRRQIKELAAATDNLAVRSDATYGQFEVILGELHKLGMFPTNSLVSDVAHAFHAAAAY